MRKHVFTASLLILAFAAPAAHAHKAGEFILRAGAAHVEPVEDSSPLRVGGAAVIGTRATLNDDTQLGLAGTYMLSDGIGIELLAATPFRHAIGIDGVDAALGTPAGTLDGGFAVTKHLPPTLSLQFYPLDSQSRIQPYVGAGVNFTWFFDESLSDRQKANGFSNLRLKDSWGMSLQAGVDYMLTDRLLLNAAVWRLDIDATASVEHDGLGHIEVDVDIDPWVHMIGLGYRF